MRRRSVKQREKESDRELARRQRVNEEQETEMEALEAIFAGLMSTDTENIDIDHDYPRAFSIHVVPHPAVPESNHSYIDLVIRLSREYPASVPQFEFRSSKGLSKKELAILMNRINFQATTMLNEPMIYEIVTTIQEELRLHNHPETSLHEEMVQKQKQEVREILEIEKERVSENLRLQREMENRLAEIKATEDLTGAAEKQLRKNWLESKAANAAANEPTSDKETLWQVQLLLAHLLRQQSKDSSLSSLVNSGLIPDSMANMPFSSLSTQVSDLSSRFQLSIPRMSPRSSLPSIENQASALPSEATGSRSRYHTDFIEIEMIGKGSFGRVVKVQNRLDGLYYAMKIIEMRMENESDFRRILREVTALSRLSHPYVLRYYQAFIECVSSDPSGSSLLRHREFEDSLEGGTIDNTFDWSLHSDSLYNNNNNNIDLGPFQIEMTEPGTATSDPKLASKHSVYELYIQTEFCAQTLRETIACEARRIDPEQNWRRFRQILEGLAHIHAQGICHRDLKLGNIFVHPCGDVRIGDLGLATHFQMTESLQHRLSPSTSPNELTAEQTTAIGTLLYTAPEIIQTGSTSRYDSKVDMYSLGIVFFEMWYPFSTGHERVHVLQKLRQLSGPIFPDWFPESHPRQSQIIRWLLQVDPNDRPSALELLQSNLLPPKLEDEYMKDALRTISNPNTPFYHRLLSELFNSVRPMASEISSVSLPSPINISTNPHLAAACQHYVVTAVRAAFESRSGVERCGQIMQRSMPSLSSDSQILLMDREGRLLDLRRDLRSDLVLNAAFGRYFQIGPVFRVASPGKGKPRHIFQADFDLLGPDAEAPYADAEILSLQLALSDMFPILGETRLQIGHKALTSAVLDICHVPEEIRPILLEFVKDVQSSLGSQIDQFRQFLSRYSSQLNVPLLVSIVSHRGSPADGIVHLRNHFVHNREALAALNELEEIIAAATLFGVLADKIEVSPLITVSPGHYSGFISKVFVVPKGVRTCLTVGGRYNLLKTEVQSNLGGVGLSLAIEQLWEMLSVVESQERRPNKTVLAHCTDVFVASIGSKEVFEERLKIVGELYSIGMNVAFLPSKSATLEEQQEAAAVRNSQWMLTIKDKYVQTSVRMRQLDSDKKQEFDLPRDEIIKFFSGSKHVPWRKR